jgi:hypothetical protein
MTAFLAWIDFDQADRDRTRRIMDLFGEEGTRDELGIGGIRDGLSDLMFPGTSTIQTRLRYMLFVPWIFRMAATHPGPPAARVTRARALEMRLIGALERCGETRGVIGRDAREMLKRLPSDVYWAGLKALGIRQVEGGREACLGLGPGGPNPVWAAGLPEAPDGFLEADDFATGFSLTVEEAGFLRDRLQAAAPDSLFARLAFSDDTAEAAQIWAHPSRGDWPDDLQRIVTHAERLAVAVEGAARLYNRELARHAEATLGDASGKWRERAEAHDAALADWHAADPARALADWDFEALWTLITDKTVYRVTPMTRAFLADWCAAVIRTGGAVGEDAEACALIRRREERLKRSKARFRNGAALARWGGNSGTAVLSYRWGVVAQHLQDLAHAR